MARTKETITARSGIMVNGVFTEIKDLSAEQRSEWQERAMERVAKAHENYFRQHPDELEDYIKLPGVTFEPYTTKGKEDTA